MGAAKARIAEFALSDIELMLVQPRLLFVTRNFPPLTGGMERLNQQAFMSLAASYRATLCGPEGASAFLPPGADVCEVPLSPLWRFLAGAQLNALKLARRERPDIVYSGSGLTAPAALIAGRVVGARTVCYLHGLDIVADHPLYRHVFLPAICRVDRIIVNSRHTAGLAQMAGVRSERIAIVNPGVDLPDWTLRDGARQRFRQLHRLGERPLLLAAGRLTQRKGLAEFIRHALPAIREQVPDVLLLIVGSEATSALKHRDGVEAGIRATITETAMTAHVRLLGAVDDRTLSDAYFAADAMVFPVLDLPGDVEGFGMVAVEAAAHGLPTVAFAVGGVPDAIKDGTSGWLVPSGNYGQMVDKTLSTLAITNRETWAEPCRNHAERFKWANFGQQLARVVANGCSNS